MRCPRHENLLFMGKLGENPRKTHSHINKKKTRYRN